MNLGDIIKTKRWKVFMGYVYGWGAAIVMIGALFKLEHLKYSGLLLAIGLITEAFIFFLSDFVSVTVSVGFASETVLPFISATSFS